MSKLLINEQPLQVLPSLAVKVGLNEAIILQQLHYWSELNRQQNKNFYNGYYWVYNTYEDWQKQFPFWSAKTIQRAITKLEKLGLVVSDNFNKVKMDRTKWYRIDYEALRKLEDSRIGQNDQIVRSKCPDLLDKMTKPIPENTTENNYREIERYIKENQTDVLKETSKNNENCHDESVTDNVSIDEEAIEIYNSMPRKDGDLIEFILIYRKLRSKYSKEYIKQLIERYKKAKKLKSEEVYHKPENFFKSGEFKKYLDENWNSTLEECKLIFQSRSQTAASPNTNSQYATEDWEQQLRELGW